MREILFRGKEIGSGKWITGHGYAKYDFSRYVFDDEYLDEIRVPRGLVMVFADTVGQYTGQKDYSGAKIFEGDIVDFTVYDFDDPRHYRGIVTFSKKYCDFELWKSLTDFEHDGHGPYPVGWSLEQDKGLKVIGNIHDNPELLSGGK